MEEVNRATFAMWQLGQAMERWERGLSFTQALDARRQGLIPRIWTVGGQVWEERRR